LSSWRETLENAFKDIGDISGFTVFDAGSEGAAARFLAERIGEGRIIGVNIWIGAYKAVRERVGNLMNKVVLIKDDMRHMDYLKDSFFDLVVSYATMQSIEKSTPGGTSAILHQFYRILKQNGRLLIVEPIPPHEVKPANEAQELDLKLRQILDRLTPVKEYYNQKQLSEMLMRVGFEETYWKMVSEGEWSSNHEITGETKGIRNLANEVIQDEKEKEETLRQIREISRQAKRTGLQTPPYYALYARKP